jgi:hypothetical protein
MIGNFESNISSDKWIEFKDEKSFKLFDSLENYENAKKLCKRADNSATLVSIRSKDEQEFLENYLFRTSRAIENIWIGAKRHNSSFSLDYFEDGIKLVFNNWDLNSVEKEGNNCVEMLSDNESNDNLSQGKWKYVSCLKRNLVLCQIMKSWSTTELKNKFIDFSREMNEFVLKANKKIDKLTEELKYTLNSVEEYKRNSGKNIKSLIWYSKGFRKQLKKIFTFGLKIFKNNFF